MIVDSVQTFQFIPWGGTIVAGYFRIERERGSHAKSCNPLLREPAIHKMSRSHRRVPSSPYPVYPIPILFSYSPYSPMPTHFTSLSIFLCPKVPLITESYASTLSKSPPSQPTSAPSTNSNKKTNSSSSPTISPTNNPINRQPGSALESITSPSTRFPKHADISVNLQWWIRILDLLGLGLRIVLRLRGNMSRLFRLIRLLRGCFRGTDQMIFFLSLLYVSLFYNFLLDVSLLVSLSYMSLSFISLL